MPIEIKQLRYFSQIAAHANLSRAAKALGVAQPALSLQLSNLETYLGVKLFTRSAHGMLLTEAGVRLLSHAEYILDRIAQAENELRDRGGSRTKLPLMVGMPPSLAGVLAIPLMKRLEERHPSIHVRIMERYSPILREALLASQIDLAVMLEPGEAQSFSCEKLFEEEFWFVASAGNTARLPKRLCFADLAAFPLIVPIFPDELRAQMEQLAQRAGITLNFAAELQSMTLMVQALQEGRYFAVMPPSSIQEELVGGRLVAAPIAEAPLRRDIWIVAPRAPGLSRAGHTVRAELLALMLEMVEAGVLRGVTATTAVRSKGAGQKAQFRVVPAPGQNRR